jgi:Ca-activated chloride channel family protein
MKLIKISLISAAILLAAAIPPFFTGYATPQSPQQKPSQKDNKDKKPSDADQGKEDQAIKLGASLVTVPFNVTDKKNAYINSLTKSDIEVLEDNKPQQIFSFERQTDLPITIAMLIDISGSEEYTLPMEKSAGSRFFSKVLRPNKDLGAVVTFENEAVLLQDLTGDAGKLQRALNRVRPSVVSASSGGVTGTPPIINSGAGSTALYDAIYSVSSDLLRREAGRRVIILITDGVDTSSTLKMRDAIERTWRSEVIIYSIGIGDPGFGGVDSGGLKKMASETGGRAFFPRRETDLDQAFSQIDEDLRQQYILAYQPTNEIKDGSFRTIQVRVKDHKDLTVRYRRGYFAPKES